MLSFSHRWSRRRISRLKSDFFKSTNSALTFIRLIIHALVTVQRHGESAKYYCRTPTLLRVLHATLVTIRGVIAVFSEKNEAIEWPHESKCARRKNEYKVSTILYFESVIPIKVNHVTSRGETRVSVPRQILVISFLPVKRNRNFQTSNCGVRQFKSNDLNHSQTRFIYFLIIYIHIYNNKNNKLILIHYYAVFQFVLMNYFSKNLFL